MNRLFFNRASYRMLCLLLSLCILLPTAACGKTEEGKKPSETNATSGQEVLPESEAPNESEVPAESEVPVDGETTEKKIEQNDPVVLKPITELKPVTELNASAASDDCSDGVCEIPSFNEQGEAMYAMVSPVGYHSVDSIEQAARLDTLEGKTIALVGGSFMAAETHQKLKECILNAYPTATVYLLRDPDEQAALTDTPDWLKGIVSEPQIETIATMIKGQTPLLVVGDADRNKFQVMPGGGYVTAEIKLPENWDELVAPLGYEPLSSFYIES